MANQDDVQRSLIAPSRIVSMCFGPDGVLYVATESQVFTLIEGALKPLAFEVPPRRPFERNEAVYARRVPNDDFPF